MLRHSPRANPFVQSHSHSEPRGEESWAPCQERSLKGRPEEENKQETWSNWGWASGETLIKTSSHASPILTGVPPRLGMHGSGHRSRHSGCETTLQSRHFSEILPNLILFPHGTQDSGLITCKRQPLTEIHISEMPESIDWGINPNI